jgi:hypothetical protein
LWLSVPFARVEARASLLHMERAVHLARAAHDEPDNVLDREHGLQFKATTMKTVPPPTAEAILWLDRLPM